MTENFIKNINQAISNFQNIGQAIGNQFAPKKDMLETYNKLPDTYKHILDRLAETMLKQSEKGKEKYGMSIDENTNQSAEYWLQHALEEMADFLVYFEKFKNVKK